MGGSPVTDDIALKAKLAFEDFVEKFGVLATVCLIDPVAVHRSAEHNEKPVDTSFNILGAHH
jgi:hypothetical protein